MADAVPTNGFNIPPAGDGNPVIERGNTPPSAPQAPAPAPQGSYTQADIDRAVAAALAGRQAPAPAAPIPAVPSNPAAALDISDTAESDPLLSSLTNTFTSIGNGVDINRAIGHALTLGNPALIDKAYLAEKGGAQAATLVALAESIVNRVQEQTRSAEAAVHSAAGSKENWDAAAAAFNKQAPVHLKAVVAKLLESGSKEAVQSGAQYVIDYARQQGLVPQAAGLVQSGAGLGSAQALSKGAFQDALHKLDPNSRTYIQDRNDLFARRQAGKQLGIN